MRLDPKVRDVLESAHAQLGYLAELVDGNRLADDIRAIIMQILEQDNADAIRAMMRAEQPMQPVVIDEHGVVRFQENKVVRYLERWASSHGCTLNDLSIIEFPRDDWQHFMQLIGYSVSGYGDLSSHDPAVCAIADAVAAELVKRKS